MKTQSHAFRVIRLSPFIAAATAILYIVSCAHVPFSATYQLVAVFTAAVSFALLCSYWRNPSVGLFVAQILIPGFASSLAQDFIFDSRHPMLWFTAQFFYVWGFVLTSLVFLFRRRMQAWIDNAATSGITGAIH